MQVNVLYVWYSNCMQSNLTYRKQLVNLMTRGSTVLLEQTISRIARMPNDWTSTRQFSGTLHQETTVNKLGQTTRLIHCHPKLKPAEIILKTVWLDRNRERFYPDSVMKERLVLHNLTKIFSHDLRVSVKGCQYQLYLDGTSYVGCYLLRLRKDMDVLEVDEHRIVQHENLYEYLCDNWDVVDPDKAEGMDLDDLDMSELQPDACDYNNFYQLAKIEYESMISIGIAEKINYGVFLLMPRRMKEGLIKFYEDKRVLNVMLHKWQNQERLTNECLIANHKGLAVNNPIVKVTHYVETDLHDNDDVWHIISNKSVESAMEYNACYEDSIMYEWVDQLRRNGTTVNTTFAGCLGGTNGCDADPCECNNSAYTEPIIKHKPANQKYDSDSDEEQPTKKVKAMPDYDADDDEWTCDCVEPDCSVKNILEVFPIGNKDKCIYKGETKCEYVEGVKVVDNKYVV